VEGHDKNFFWRFSTLKFVPVALAAPPLTRFERGAYT